HRSVAAHADSDVLVATASHGRVLARRGFRIVRIDLHDPAVMPRPLVDRRIPRQSVVMKIVEVLLAAQDRAPWRHAARAIGERARHTRAAVDRGGRAGQAEFRTRVVTPIPASVADELPSPVFLRNAADAHTDLRLLE